MRDEESLFRFSRRPTKHISPLSFASVEMTRFCRNTVRLVNNNPFALSLSKGNDVLRRAQDERGKFV
jgi:hypothetical protein